MTVGEIEQPVLAALLSLSLRCRLLQDGGWIHSGDGMQFLLDSRVISQLPSADQKRQFVNCPGFSFGVRVSSIEQSKAGAEIRGQLRVMPFVYRVLPLRQQEERGRVVFCLPRLASPATLDAQETQPPSNAPLKTHEDFKRFW